MNEPIPTQLTECRPLTRADAEKGLEALWKLRDQGPPRTLVHPMSTGKLHSDIDGSCGGSLLRVVQCHVNAEYACTKCGALLVSRETLAAILDRAPNNSPKISAPPGV